MQPSTKGQIYHAEIIVSDFRKSAEFYDAFLGWLGYRRIFYEEGSWGKEAGWGVGSCNFWVSQCKDRFVKHGYHRKRVGLNHIAFHADSRNMVDQFYKQHLLPQKIPVLYGGPKEYPYYSKGYYSVYFEDPDRVKLELAYVPEFRKPIASRKGKRAFRAPRPSGRSSFAWFTTTRMIRQDFGRKRLNMRIALDASSALAKENSMRFSSILLPVRSTRTL